jgi:hypothetical protein
MIFLAPLLYEVNALLDKRLVRTLVQRVEAILSWGKGCPLWDAKRRKHIQASVLLQVANAAEAIYASLSATYTVHSIAEFHLTNGKKEAILSRSNKSLLRSITKGSKNDKWNTL